MNVNLGLRVGRYLTSLQVVVLIGLVCFALGFTPKGFDRLAERIDATILRVAIDFIELPPPDTVVTVVRVPDLEYDAWLADIAGAEALADILNKAKEGGAVVGFLADDPVRFIQSRADQRLKEWSAQSSIRPSSVKKAIRAHVEEREALLEDLKTRVIIGVAGRGSAEGESINSVPAGHSLLPNRLSRQLWSIPETEKRFSIPRVVVEHYPAPVKRQIWQALLMNNNGELRESFLMRLLRGYSGYEVQSWHQMQDISLVGLEDRRQVSIGYDGRVIPLYGAYTQIKAPAVQLTLAASERQERFSGWVLIGRDNDHTLALTAQMLMSVGDGAYLTVPSYFVYIKLVGALLLILLFFFFILKKNIAWACALTSTFLVFFLALHFAYAVLWGVFLPLGQVYLASLLTVLLAFISWVRAMKRR